MKIPKRIHKDPGLIVQCSQWLAGCMSDVCPNVSSKSWVVSRVKPSGMLLVLASRCDWVVHMIQKPSLKQCNFHKNKGWCAVEWA